MKLVRYEINKEGASWKLRSPLQAVEIEVHQLLKWFSG
jgi:hypothetical protein